MICQAYFCSSTRLSDLDEKFCIDFREFLPLTWNIIFVINRLDWAYGFAGTAVNALIRLDVEHPVTFVDAIDWTFLNARFVLHIDTWLGNHISHEQPPEVQV